MRLPRTAFMKLIDSCTVAERRDGSMSAGAQPITRSNIAASTPPFTASLPSPPRCSGLTGSSTTSTVSELGKPTFIPKWERV